MVSYSLPVDITMVVHPLMMAWVFQTQTRMIHLRIPGKPYPT
jgi:hypothetical protein